MENAQDSLPTKIIENLNEETVNEAWKLYRETIGVGKPHTVKTLGKMTISNSFDILFFFETKCANDKFLIGF